MASDEDTSQNNFASALVPGLGPQVDNSVSKNLDPTPTVANESNIDSQGLTNPGTSIDQSQIMMQTPSVPANASLSSINMIDPSLSYETNFNFPWETGLGPTFNQQYTGIPPLSQNENEFNSIYSELMMNSEREMAFLTRHYAECLGPWYDFFI